MTKSKLVFISAYEGLAEDVIKGAFYNPITQKFVRQSDKRVMIYASPSRLKERDIKIIRGKKRKTILDRHDMTVDALTKDIRKKRR